MQKILPLLFLSLFLYTSAYTQYANPPADILARMKQEEVTYTSNGIKCKAFIAYLPAEKKKPVVMIVPEWWGYGEYVKVRARMLAQLGYVAVAVDMYGDGKFAATPEEAKKLSAPFYADPRLAGQRLSDAEHMLLTIPSADISKVAAIGYCFGGSAVLNAAKTGLNFKGVVSFHGGLKGGLPARKGAVKGKILICHGLKDQTMTAQDILAFRKNLDSAGVNYTFKTYPNATHAFTNPEATANGLKFNMPTAYNADADRRSWNDMKLFLMNVFKSSVVVSHK